MPFILFQEDRTDDSGKPDQDYFESMQAFVLWYRYHYNATPKVGLQTGRNFEEVYFVVEGPMKCRLFDDFPEPPEGYTYTDSEIAGLVSAQQVLDPTVHGEPRFLTLWRVY